MLSGILAGTSWEERLRPFPVSLRWEDLGARPGARHALRQYLTSLELAPPQLAGQSHPAALVDILARGLTFGELVTTWRDWAEELGIRWEQVRTKLGLVGITERRKTSPRTWRWQQHVPWATLLPPRAIKNVSVPAWFWSELADRPKASRSFPPQAWVDPTIVLPPRHPAALAGLREAAFCYETGRAAQTRERFAAQLTRTLAVRAPWLRGLAYELRARPGDAVGFVPVPDDTPPAVFARQRQRRAERRQTRRSLASGSRVE